MKSFGTFLTEARRNPKVNKREAPYYALKDYNKPGFYCTYITDPKRFETNTKKQNEDERADSPVVLLNLKSKFMTPWGIYTYSMLDMYKEYPPPSESDEQVFRPPFAGEKPWIAVLQKTPECRTLHTPSYKTNNLRSDLPKLRHDILQLMQKKHGKDFQKTQSLDFFNDIVTFSRHLAKSNRVASKLWNITRMSGFLVEKNWNEISELFAKDEEVILSTLKKFVPRPTLWATIIRRAKDDSKQFYYDLVDDPGLSVVHENEPRQAVFFSRRGYRVVKLIPNTDIEYNRKHSSTRFAKREGELETHIRRGKDIRDIPRDRYSDLARILTKKGKDKKTLLDKKKMTEKLPPIVDKEILSKDLDYYDQLVDVDRKALMLALASNISPKEIRDFLVGHPEIKFSQEDLNNLVQRHPHNLSAILHLNPNPQTIIDVIEDDPIAIVHLSDYNIPLESPKQYKIPVAVQRVLPKIFDKVFSGETKSKGSKTLQSQQDERVIRMTKSRVLDLIHTKRLLPEVSNALVNILVKNNQLSKAEQLQIKQINN